MSKKNKYYFKLKEVIILVLATALTVSLATGIIIGKRYTNEYQDLSITDENINKFVNAYQSLTENYYQEINKEDLINNVILSMFNYLQDPYTTYLTEEESRGLVDSLKGEYEGIGVVITNDNGILVAEVLEGSPAYDSGIEAGDYIIKVNDEDVSSKSTIMVAEMITSSTNKEVKITVLRNNKEMNFTLEVKKITIPSVTYEQIDSKTAYIDIDVFSLTTSKQIREKMSVIQNTDTEYLIIDLRDNTGGYLTIAEDIAKIFLEKGEIIYSIEDKDGITAYKDDNNESSNLKIAILINGESASASEVLAGALKDSYGAIIVGETSYGKGKVQQAETLDDGSMLKYTIARWLRPNGECVDEVGIIPDYEVTNSNQDDQLLKAIEVLNK